MVLNRLLAKVYPFLTTQHARLRLLAWLCYYTSDMLVSAYYESISRTFEHLREIDLQYTNSSKTVVHKDKQKCFTP